MKNQFELEPKPKENPLDWAMQTVDQERYHEEAFKGEYSEEDINKDLKKVEDLEQKFKESDKQNILGTARIGKIFETSIVWHGQQSDWFGPNARVKKASRYDDYVNGIDMIMMFKGQEEGKPSHLGLAADVTFSKEAIDKMGRVRSQMEKGKLMTVKYVRGIPDHQLPEVIIGIDKDTVLEVSDLWKAGKTKEIAGHRMQVMVLLQIKAQLYTFANYADSINKPDLAKTFRSRLAIIEEVLSQKENLIKKFKYELNDPVHLSIMGYMKSWQEMLEGGRKAAA